METIVGKPAKLLLALKNLNQEKDYELKEYRKKRSLSQNSYAWELIGKLADALRISKDEMYLEMLRGYGQSMRFTFRSDINPYLWFKYYDIEDISPDEKRTTYRCYRGSSTYDSREMSIFIDGIIQECENVGISTVTPDEIARWKLN